ncbi:MAG: bifunctional aldolase/short-chain dehydrogenase [Gammaproteobacteria bacterium]|nr:bifunctional aldolase/short-chain dehydrogenase [Gammaproteobacteria bacterium]
MQNRWDDQEAASFEGDLQLRVYTSRLLGRDTTLVLHGGGNTSVKLTARDIFGEPQDLLYVKGSGWDLEHIDVPGFPPVRMDHLLRLAQLPALSDPQMVNELKTHTIDAGAPTPSVEAILHAILPYKYVDHTHADAVIAVTNTPDGLAHVKRIFGDTVVIIPYIMPGFDLARLCAQEFARQRNANTLGMVLMNHGIFSFGETARESYERMITLVSRAEAYLKQHQAWDIPALQVNTASTTLRHDIADFRRRIAKQIGYPVILQTCQDNHAMQFIQRPDLASISQQGPATPDHVIRTKRLPLLGRDLQAYAAQYQDYFDTLAPQAKDPKTMLDPLPRVILDAEFGLCTVGRTAKDAQIVQDIYRHTMDIIQRADMLGGYQALPARDIFDVEYWDLEQAKLRKAGNPPMFSGEVVLITGAASGIGKACVDAFLQRGAAVVGIDIDPAITTLKSHPAYHGLVCDVTDVTAMETVLEQTVRRFGGLDMLVLNAGIFPGGQHIAELDLEEWHKVQAINLNANLNWMQACHPLLKLAPKGGRVVIMGSKNVAAPGQGAAAYSAAKAALTQLMRIAAMEWASDHIRINALHPDAVFDTGIWSDDVLAARAQHYGMSVEEYKQRNLLKVSITSADVAALTAELCGPLFAKTTAAQIPIDGGDIRVI